MNPINKIMLVKEITNNKNELQKFGVHRLGIFGSFVRNEATPQSDIDILVEFEKGKKKFDNFIHLAFFLENLLQRKVEIITPESLSPYIAPYIMKEVEYVFSN